MTDKNKTIHRQLSEEALQYAQAFVDGDIVDASMTELVARNIQVIIDGVNQKEGLRLYAVSYYLDYEQPEFKLVNASSEDEAIKLAMDDGAVKHADVDLVIFDGKGVCYTGSY